MSETPDPMGAAPPEPTDAATESPGDGGTGPPKKKPLLLVVAAVVVVAIAAIFFLTKSKGVDTATPTEAKSCLEEAGYDTSGETGIISLFAGGKDLEIQDQFPAFRGSDRLAVFFFASEGDAEAAAETLPNFLQQQAPEAPEPEGHAVGSATLLVIEGTSGEAVTEVEGCLGA